MGVLVDLDDRSPLGAGQQSRQGLAFALDGVDGPGLVAFLVDGQHDAAVEQFFVDVDGGGGQKDGDRSGHPVGVSGEAPGGVLAGRSDGQLAFGLQQLEGVGGPLGALLLGHG